MRAKLISYTTFKFLTSPFSSLQHQKSVTILSNMNSVIRSPSTYPFRFHNSAFSNTVRREFTSITPNSLFTNNHQNCLKRTLFPFDFCSNPFQNYEFSFNKPNQKMSVSASSRPKSKSKPKPEPNSKPNTVNYYIESNAPDIENAICPGCGIEMQDENPTAPGYFKRPTLTDKTPVVDFDPELVDDLINEEEEEDEKEQGDDNLNDIKSKFGEESKYQTFNLNVKSKVQKVKTKNQKLKINSQIEFDQEVSDEVPEVGFEDFDEKLDSNILGVDLSHLGLDGADENTRAEMEAWGRIWDEEDDKDRKKELKNKKKQKELEKDKKESVVVCARCHSLRHYGHVKDKNVENLLPDFDFDQMIGSKLRNAYGRRSVVVMVIDASDFDGSFPKIAAQILTEAENLTEKNYKEGKPSNTFRLLIVANKVDLIPKQVSAIRFEHWIRRRAKAGGAPRVSGVFIVSAKSAFGIQQLSDSIQDLAGPRGDVWVIGAQNAGKSSLINALIKLKKSKVISSSLSSPSLSSSSSILSTETILPSSPSSSPSPLSSFPSPSPSSFPALLTEASLPGTTIGVVSMEGVFPGRIRLLDTPGVLHPHQISTRLTQEELRMVLPRKLLKPRTFRIKVGNALHIGGLSRIDVLKGPSESLYLTVWVSSYIPIHMGKIENADSVFSKHVGDRLQPPFDVERVKELGKWLPRTVHLEGDKWDESSVDVAIAGLGWIGVAVNGRADLRVFTYEGVSVTVREAMVLDLDKEMQRPGFSHVVPLPPLKESGKGERKGKGEGRKGAKEEVGVLND